MFLQNHLNIDSIRVVQDSIKASTQDTVLMNSLGFNISNVGSSELVTYSIRLWYCFSCIAYTILVFCQSDKVFIGD